MLILTSAEPTEEHPDPELRKCTYSELYDMVADVASALLLHGLKPGDRVASYSGNCIVSTPLKSCAYLPCPPCNVNSSHITPPSIKGKCGRVLGYCGDWRHLGQCGSRFRTRRCLGEVCHLRTYFAYRPVEVSVDSSRYNRSFCLRWMQSCMSSFL